MSRERTLKKPKCLAITRGLSDLDRPAYPSHAFSFTTKVEGAQSSFVNSGGGSAVEGKSFTIIRPGDTSADGLREKAHYVLGQMERRMAALGFNWSD